MQNSTLYKVAKKSLETNIVTLADKSFLSAGYSHFRTLWTRDFLFSIRGLIAIDRFDVVADHLKILYEHVNEDGLAPLYLDSMHPLVRVALATVRLKRLPIKSNLKAHYHVLNQYPAIDSNLLLIIGSFEYAEKCKDSKWIPRYKEILLRLYAYYESKLHNGLISQPPFSDWQDSLRREGQTALTNLFYLRATELLFPTSPKIQFIKDKIYENFYDTKRGLLRTQTDLDIVSLDANLFAIEWNYFEAKAIYEALKRHSIWGDKLGPGFANFPSYSYSEVGVHVKLVGLEEYHGSNYWAWLMAFAMKVANDQGDEIEVALLLKRLKRVIMRDGDVGEIYRPTQELPLWQNILYQSEIPFSWGASFILDALKSVR